MYYSKYTRKRGSRRAIAEMNVVPYIDVMLVLLVIFMIATPLLTPGVKVQLPQAQAQALEDHNNKPLIISVDKEGHYYLNTNVNPQQALNAHDLVVKVAARLQIEKSLGEKSVVMVKGDTQASYGQVVGAMVLLQRAGVAQVGLITQNPPSQGVA
ncbi:MAG: tolR [Gammaproteobacteria bacterium]|jgi:biopolymer transport protein TolR|nr:tolR [Gammaproteobacteria bacterium]